MMFGRNKKYKEAKKQGEKVVETSKNPILDKLKKGFAIVLFCLFLFYSVTLFIHQQKQLNSLNEQKRELENEIINIQEQTRGLEEEAIKLHDKEYIEYIARKDYGMVGEGDIVFIPAQEIGE